MNQPECTVIGYEPNWSHYTEKVCSFSCGVSNHALLALECHTISLVLIATQPQHSPSWLQLIELTFINGSTHVVSV